MTREEFLEAMADAAHACWADWMKYHRSRGGYRDGCRDFHTPEAWQARWDRQMELPYAELREDEKQSDRDVIAKYYLPIIEAFMTSQERLRQEAAIYSMRPSTRFCFRSGDLDNPDGGHPAVVKPAQTVECDHCHGGAIVEGANGRWSVCPVCEGIGKVNATP